MKSGRVNILSKLKSSKRLALITTVGAFMIIGGISTLIARAATNFASIEPENSTSLVSPVTSGVDASASGGKYIQFGDVATTPTPPPPTPSTFQPTAPYHATFFYPWYKNKTTDGAYSYWQDGGNTPPTKWFAHYLPDINPTAFDPATELYSSNSYDTFKWQVDKMAEAKQEVSIASWFGQGSKQDTAISTYLNDFMKRSDNPYPNLRWALYYECEGITSAQSSDCPSSTGDPTTAQIVSDLTHIKNTMSDSPYFLKINGKPVIFVYGATEGLATSQRWKDANAQMGNQFYVVLKVYNGYQTDPNQPDSWHQYGPASNYGAHGTYSAYVSPGFWKDVSDPVDGAVRLARDLTRFQTDVSKMASASVTWKLVQTWNEWGEGSSVEPGNQTIIDAAGKEVLDPNGAPFGNAYVQALADRLPPLEAGKGSGVAGAQAPSREIQSPSAVQGTAAYSFTAGGDSGIRANADLTFAKIVTAAPAFNLLLGDLDYDDVYGAYNGANDADYCAYAKSKLSALGSNFPMQIISGNHEEQGGVDGYIMNHAACLPDKMNSTGDYARQYFFDYPAAAPNLRTIMIAANLKVENVDYIYTKGSPYYNWVSSSIDDARAKGITWIVVGMHKTCISVGEKTSCEIGKDLFNLLLEKKVDVILQGHDHNYQRSKQLALSPNCPSIVTAGFNAACVSGSGDNYVKGAGPVLLVNGVFGKCCYATNPADPEVGYFTKYQSTNTSGVVKFNVTDERIDAEFLNSTGTFTDSFSIAPATGSDTVAPAVELTSPPNASTVAGAVSLAANASDNVGVSKVEFLVDGAVVNTDTAAPYSFSWQSTSVGNGLHSVQAVAYDAAGNRTASNISSVSVSNGCTVPQGIIGSVSYTVSIPQGTYKTWVRIKAPNSTNNSLYVTTNGTCNAVLGDSTSIPIDQWTWINTDATSTPVSASVTGSSSTVTIMGREAGVKLDRALFLADTCVPTGVGDNCTTVPDTTPPSVTITTPVEGSALSAVNDFTATATDGESAIAKLELYIDGTLIATDTAAPYTTSYDVAKLKPGQHIFEAKAYNVGGLSASTKVNFTANDTTGPQVSITAPANNATVSAHPKVTLSATDNGTLSKAEFYVDGNIIGTVPGIGPYEISWDTWQVSNGSHTLTAKVYDAAGNATTSSGVTVTVDNDMTPPSAPSGVTTTALSATSVKVTWNAATDNTGVTGYYVLRDGVVLVNTMDPVTLTYTDQSVVAGTSYSYTVIAYDANRNQSAPSAASNVTTPTLADTSAPSVPGGVTATAVSASQINVSWNASTDTGGSGLKEYRVYRNEGLVGTITGTSFGDAGLTAGTTYNYKVTAVDGAGNVSSPSSVVAATTSAPASSTSTYVPSEDTFASASRATRNYGNAASVEVDGNSQKIAYLKFTINDLAGKSVTRAILRLKVLDPSTVGGTFYSTSSTWTEATLTWNNKPSLGLLIGTVGNAPRGATVEVDVSSLIQGNGTYSIGVMSANSNGVDYYSSEATTADRPALVVTVQ